MGMLFDQNSKLHTEVNLKADLNELMYAQPHCYNIEVNFDFGFFILNEVKTEVKNWTDWAKPVTSDLILV